MKKVGIIRCQQTEHLCPGSMDMKIVAKGLKAFEPYGPSQLVGFVSCGGCPGKQAVARAEMMVKNGAEVIAITSCISKGTPIGFPCPNKDAMLAAIRAKVGEHIEVLEYTH